MTRLRTCPAPFALILALTAPSTRAAETIKWAPKPGETLKYTLNQVFDAKTAVPGQEVASKTELTVDLTWKVNAIAADGTVELAQTVDHVRAKNTAPGAVVTYDSSDKKTAEAPFTQVSAKAYEAVLGKPYAIRLSPRGQVVDVKLPEGATEALAGSPLAAMADSGTFFSPTGVKNLLAQVLPTLPKDAAEKGATWDNELTLPSGPLRVVVRTKYTLAEVAPVATIDARLDSTMTPVPEAKLTVKVNKQSGTGRFTFDPAAGRLDAASITQAAEITINDGNADFTQSIEATLSFKRVP